MYKMLEFTGRKSRKIERIIRSLYETKEQSTHQIENLFETGKLCITTNELTNVLKKSGLFRVSGYVTVRKYGNINSYQICKWEINYDGLIKKYGVEEFNTKQNKSQYVLDTETYELHHLPVIRKTELWEEIKKERGKEE